jgi:hypothetical protein
LKPDGTKGTPAVIAVMILGAFGALAEGKRRAPDSYCERAEAEVGRPYEAFSSDACLQNSHFHVRGVLDCFKRLRYSLLPPVCTAYRPQTEPRSLPEHSEDIYGFFKAGDESFRHIAFETPLG